MVLPQIERHGRPKPGSSMTLLPQAGPAFGGGVAWQYCGQLGKEENCRVAVSLSLANGYASLPVAYRLYLPREWMQDRERLRKVGVPEEIGFTTKHEIVLAKGETCAGSNGWHCQYGNWRRR